MTLTLGPVIGKVGGAQVEEIPVSMSGGGRDTVYPLTTVDAGDGALVVVTGTMDPGATAADDRPHLTIGTRTIETPHTVLDGSDNVLGAFASGVVQVAVLSRYFSTNNPTTFSGTVYVVRL